jgi:hypothetical protein
LITLFVWYKKWRVFYRHLFVLTLLWLGPAIGSAHNLAPCRWLLSPGERQAERQSILSFQFGDEVQEDRQIRALARISWRALQGSQEDEAAVKVLAAGSLSPFSTCAQYFFTHAEDLRSVIREALAVAAAKRFTELAHGQSRRLESELKEPDRFTRVTTALRLAKFLAALKDEWVSLQNELKPGWSNQEANREFHHGVGHFVSTVDSLSKTLWRDRGDYLVETGETNHALNVGRALSRAVQRTMLLRWSVQQFLVRDLNSTERLNEVQRRASDLQTLENVLAEIFQNAAKYSDSNKQLKWVEVSWDGSILSIIDNGLGISSVSNGLSGIREHGPGIGEGMVGVQAQLNELRLPYQLKSEPLEKTSWEIDLSNWLQKPKQQP